MVGKGQYCTVFVFLPSNGHLCISALERTVILYFNLKTGMALVSHGILADGRNDGNCNYQYLEGLKFSILWPCKYQIRFDSGKWTVRASILGRQENAFCTTGKCVYTVLERDI